MFKEIVDDGRPTSDDRRRMTDIGRSQKLTMSTLCLGELKMVQFRAFQSVFQHEFRLFQRHFLSIFTSDYIGGACRTINKVCNPVYAEVLNGKSENNMGRQRNAGYQHFLLFQQSFQIPSSSGLFKQLVFV